MAKGWTEIPFSLFVFPAIGILCLSNEKEENKMKLSELLSVIDPNTNVRVRTNGQEIAKYDGRDSIPEGLNNCNVIEGQVSVFLNNLLVEVEDAPVKGLVMFCTVEMEKPMKDAKGNYSIGSFYSPSPIPIVVDGTPQQIGFKTTIDSWHVEGQPENVIHVMIVDPNELYQEGFDSITHSVMANGTIKFTGSRNDVITFGGFASNNKIKRLLGITLACADETIELELGSNAQPEEAGRKE